MPPPSDPPLDLVTPVQVAARSKVWVCGPSLAAIVGSNPTGGMDVLCECCVLSGRGHCEGPIPRTEESYRVWCVWEISKPQQWGGLGPTKVVVPEEKIVYISKIGILTAVIIYFCASPVTFSLLGPPSSQSTSCVLLLGQAYSLS